LCCASFCTLLSRTGGPLIVGLLIVNCVSIIVGLLVSLAYPVLLSSILIAYTLGLRHAVDADHLAAIDNVTRRMVSEGKTPVSVGLWFSLGHSTIVFALTVFVAITASLVSDYYANAAELGELVGTLISASFLYLIGAINLYCLVVLVYNWRDFQRKQRWATLVDPAEDTSPSSSPADPVRNGGEESLDQEIAATRKQENPAMGFCVRCCPKLLNIVDRPYKMYFVGFLFGLGFDTASEIALLSMAALAPGEGVPSYLVMILPVVFASAMAMIDTMDGIMMIWAYGWAFVEGDKKYFYNFVVTFTSLVIALLIGTLELLGVLGTIFDLDSPFWEALEWINYETVGIFIIALFIIFFVVAVISYKIRYGCSQTSVEFRHIGGDSLPFHAPEDDALSADQNDLEGTIQ